MNEDFSLGKMSADAKLTATFNYYEKTEKDGEIILSASLGEGEVPRLNRGYGLDGNELWLSLNNLYQEIRGKDDNTAADDLIGWCRKYAHPYYIYQEIQEYKWDIASDAEYWDFFTNILGSFTFPVRRMREDLEKLYRDTLVVLMFKKCLDQLDISEDLARITWTDEFVGFNTFPVNTHLPKISAYLNKINGFTMKLDLDENGEMKVMPDFHSVFDAARFALAKYVSIPTDYPIAYGERVGVATCECCGRLFVKKGNRQKYCDNPECKKERNRRKSRTAYRRRVQAEQDSRWA